MEDFHNLDSAINDINSSQESIQEQLSSLVSEVSADNEKLEELRNRTNALLQATGSEPLEEFKPCTLEDLNKTLVSRFHDFSGLTEQDRVLHLTPVDYIVASLAGGVAIIVDFLLVKIPKTTNYLREFEQKGSPLTELLRKIGHDNEGKQAKWIDVLENWFHVNYDSSIREGVFGPKNHRNYSGGHDASLAGLIFAVKDILFGTFTYFDKSGRLIIEKAEEMGLLQKCLAPFMWLGHLISDLFTSAGVPVPDGTLLRAIQLGEFGRKGRPFGELIDWMYMNGYDMRHLATMTTPDAAMNLIIGRYLAFISPIKQSNSQLISEREYVEVKRIEKKVKMKFIASSVAVAGNVAKICAYQGNPLAFNYSLWYEMIKQSISKVTILTKDKDAENAIEKRHLLDENFDVLLANADTPVRQDL